MYPENAKSPSFITLDLEDFCYDLSYNLGIKRSPDVNKLLWKAVDNLLFLIESCNSSKITIFSTGILAKKHPTLITHLSNLGHEIGLHNYFHEDVSAMSTKALRSKILDGKSAIEDIIGQGVHGFRAPRFSIGYNDKKRFEVLDGNFRYDSSLNMSNRRELSLWKSSMKLDILEVPVLKTKSFFSLVNIKLGGTYVKLLPQALFMRCFRDLSSTSDLPLVFYLHPYDLLSDENFHLPFSYTVKLPLHKRMYWHVRQKQWNYIGNKNSIGKWAALTKLFDNSGRIVDNLELWS